MEEEAIERSPRGCVTLHFAFSHAAVEFVYTALLLYCILQLVLSPLPSRVSTTEYCESAVDLKGPLIGNGSVRISRRGCGGLINIEFINKSLQLRKLCAY